MAITSRPPADPDDYEISFACMLAKQPLGDLYIGIIPAKTLYQICEFDVRRVIHEERDVEKYLGIQRPLNMGRVREISQYVKFGDAAFPTTIIIAVDERCATFNPTAHTMSLRNIRDRENPVPKKFIARVIDGQHRIEGLRDYAGEQFDCLVTILVGADIADQAHVFATVNLAQTKVNRSLAIDLYALQRSRSPLKTCHSVVVALDQDPSGPFFKRIKRLGLTTAGRVGETLTQATVVDGLGPYITDDAAQDRDDILRGRKLKRVDESSERSRIFRNWFIDGQDSNIAFVMSNYFDAARRKWKRAWDQPAQGEILSRTTGYLALSRLMRDIYLDGWQIGAIPSVDNFYAYFQRAEIQDHELNAQTFLPGSSGQGLLYRTLRTQILGD